MWTIYKCYLPAGRSVSEKTVPKVLSTTWGLQPRAEKRDIFMKNGDEGKDVFSDIQGIFGMDYISVLLIEFQTLQ